MPSSYTSSLRLILPVQGELSGSWGDAVNTGLTNLVDASIAGTAAVVMTDANYTLTAANAAADEARKMFVTLTGTLTAARNVICPAASKLYFVKNSTTGGFAITLKTSSGTGISVPNGSSMVLYCNGTDVIDATTHFSSLTLASALPVLSGGTGTTTSTGTGSVVLSNSPTLVTPALGTPSSATLTNATGLPISTGVSGLGTGIATFLTTPSSANLAAAVTDETGSGALVFATSPTLVTPALGTPASATLTNATGLPISTGVAGLGTGIATALAVNVGSAGAPVLFNGALGTPSSGTVTNLTGTASININGTVGATTPTTGAFTNLTFSGSATLSGGTANGVAYLNGSKVLTSGSALTFDGTALRVTGSTGLYFSGSTAGHAYMAVDGTSTADYLWFGTNTNIPVIHYINGSEQMRLTSTGLLVGLSSALANGRLQIAGSIGLSGNTQIRQATNGDGNTLQVLATQFVAGSTNSASYNYAGGGLIASVSSGDSAVLLDTGRATSTDGRFKVRNTISANTALSLEKNGVYTLYADTGSGNLGIGTTSPAYKLDIAGTTSTVRARITATTAQSDINFANTGGQLYVGVDTSAGTVTGAAYANYIYSTTTTPIVFSTSSIERMRLDASGNLGLGVTPSAWTSGFKALEIAGGFAAYASGITNNAYFDGTNWIYKTTAAATFYAISGGTHRWYTAASGTAGTAASFTQAMTLNASGNLGVGTTSPTQKLHVVGSSIVSNSMLVGGAANGAVVFLNSDGTAQAGDVSTDNTNMYLSAYSNRPIVFKTGSSGGTERMRLDASGNLGLGVTPSAWSSFARALDVGSYTSVATSHNGVGFYGFNTYESAAGVFNYKATAGAMMYIQSSSAGHQWYTAPSGTAGNAITFTQAMTLNASGQLLVGTTTNTNSSTVVSGGTISETVSGTQYLVASQYDIGTAPNEIPVNGMLGTMAFQSKEDVVISPAATAVPANIGDMVFQLTSDTSLTIKVKGSDGTVRSVALTLA